MFISVRTAVHRYVLFSSRQSSNKFGSALGLSKSSSFMHLFSPRQSPNKFGSALDLSKSSFFMHLFSPRQSPNKFGFALDLSKSSSFMHLFSSRQSSNKFGSALDLSKSSSFMHLFSSRQSSNKFGSALDLSKRFVCRKYKHLSAGCKIARIRKNRVAAIFFAKKEVEIKKYGYICTLQNRGEMPEWSIGPHSKCGVRVTVPGVRIPLSPQEMLVIS